MNDANLSVFEGTEFETLDDFGDYYVGDFPEFDAEFIDDDGALYTDDGRPPDDDIDDWKTVDIDINSAPADDAIQNNTGSGGIGTPPPPTPPGTASFGEDQEPEHSRSTPGAPSTALITLKTEDSEHSEHSKTFSSSDFDDSDWISPIYPESLWVFPPGIGGPFCEEFTRGSGVKKRL